MATEWINVKDKLPEEGQTIVAVFQLKGYSNGALKLQENNINVGNYFKNGDWFKEEKFGIGREYVISRPIFWLPVPNYKDLAMEGDE